MDPPHNISELRSFLGMVNHLGKFVPNLAEKDKALRDLLSKKKPVVLGARTAEGIHQPQARVSVHSGPAVI